MDAKNDNIIIFLQSYKLHDIYYHSIYVFFSLEHAHAISRAAAKARKIDSQSQQAHAPNLPRPSASTEFFRAAAVAGCG